VQVPQARRAAGSRLPPVRVRVRVQVQVQVLPVRLRV
jgi:hypothetical protein